MRTKGDDERKLAAVEALFQQLAPRVRGSFARTQALRWFDGFWDFVRTNEEALARRPSCQLEGSHERLPWLLLYWEDLAAHAPMHLDLFVEVVRPPALWPVASPTKVRPYDAELATTLDSAGFHVEVGRWGVRVAARDPARLLRDGLSVFEPSFTAALRFAQSMAKAERYLPGYRSDDSSSE